jgi:hypothetical protein
MHGGQGGVVTLGAFRERADAIVLHMNRFFIRYLRSLAVEFEGDLQRAILLGEIGHHNVARHYTSGNPPANRAGLTARDPAFWKSLEPCNAHSLALATGIPRETVRRKVAWLERKGWVARTGRGEVSIRPAVVAHFVPDFNLRLLNEVLKLADELRAMVSGAAGSAPDPPATQASRVLPAKKERSRGGRDVPPSRTRGTVSKRRLHERSP